MFVEAISEKAAVVNWVENFLKNQPVSFRDMNGILKSKTGMYFLKKDKGDILTSFTITKNDFVIFLDLSFIERNTSLLFNDYKILKSKEAGEAPENYFESGDSDFELRKLKEKINTLSKDLSKAVNMKKEDWKRKEVLAE